MASSPDHSAASGSDSSIEPSHSNGKKVSTEHLGQARSNDVADSNINVKLANPLAGIPQDKLQSDARTFASEHGLGHLQDVFAKGALVAQDPKGNLLFV
jgi:hypothetical protein